VKIRVLAADDHSLVRAGLKSLIAAQPDIELVAEAADGAQAVEQAIKTQPDVVLMDLTMPEYSGIPAITSIRQACPRARVIALTMHDDPSYLRSVLAAGGAGFVVKSAADTELLSAIRAAAQGRMSVYLPISEKNARGAFSPHALKDSATSPPTINLLSGREREVLQLVAEGHTNQEIANHLKLSVKSVETYRARVMEKLELRSRADLVRYALECGLLAAKKPDKLLQ
jgi:two-component system, NarL family, response regulator NreC